MSSSTFFIRPLQEADRPQWEPLWHGYLTFYERTLPPTVTECTWSMLLAGENVAGLVADASGVLLGMTHFVMHASTWSAKGYCYLEDLFVTPATRGKGVGRALIEAVFKIADEAGCARVYWNTKADNHTARALYDKMAKVSEFVQYRRP
jgi:GNAT superfamily N-acetyltransferase